MRIFTQKMTLRKLMFNNYSAVLYFMVFGFFVYSSYKIIPVWFSVKNRVVKAQENLHLLETKNQKKEQNNTELATDEGKKRYEKEFFNKLDANEKLIVIYGEDEEKPPEENLRKMTWYETQKQNFLIWLHNFTL